MLSVVHEFLTELIDGVVRQVRKVVLLIAVLVLVGGKARETLLVDIDPQGIYARDQDVNSQIKLQLVYQKRVGNILLNNKRTGMGWGLRLFQINLRQVLCRYRLRIGFHSLHLLQLNLGEG